MRLGRPKKYTTRAERNHTYYERKKQQRTLLPLPDGPYRVLYADPPWQYENDGMRKYGHAAFHYPTLSVEALCQISVKRILAKQAVLFLWVTSPFLADCFRVIKAWGFEYKTSIVWDKVKHNYGHYVSVQHELLLVCTRGTCKPDMQTLFTSVHRIPREKHSVKPEAFRHLIDALYTEGPRIELFARTTADGWDAWGNEVIQAHGETDGLAERDSVGD